MKDLMYKCREIARTTLDATRSCRPSAFVTAGVAFLVVSATARARGTATAAGSTIGGAVYDELANPITSGVPDVIVDVTCDGGFIGQGVTAGAQGIWQVSGVPEDTCTVTPSLECHSLEHVVAGVGDGRASIAIVVSAANQPANQSIQFLVVFDPGSCDDGDLCTENDSCVSGTCEGVTVDCSSLDGPCQTGVCDSQTGVCAAQPANEGLDCDDGSFCTVGATCQAGACSGGTPRDCDDSIDCTIDSCDDLVDSCLHTPDNSACDNGLFCDGAEFCDPVAGCSIGTAPCAAPLICNDASDACTGCLGDQDCDDGSPCTVDQCVGGTCLRDAINDCCVSVADCANLNPCLDVSCVANVCTVTNNTAPCDDGDPCTSGDSCSGGVCAGLPNRACDGGGDTPPQDGDADGDGVFNADDACPETSSGMDVDDQGCACDQLDADDDGTDDCDDECPNDPGKNEAGVCGCGVEDTDDDADTVTDCLDACPGTASGATVGPDGCALDVPAGQPLADGENTQGEDAQERPNRFETSVQFVRPSGCGACGALGAIFWPILLVCLFMFRSPRYGRRCCVWRYAQGKI